jgi:hypothetical protein
MGREARANPRSPDGGKHSRGLFQARFVRFADHFRTRTDFDAYVAHANVTEQERRLLEQLLPERLRVTES